MPNKSYKGEMRYRVVKKSMKKMPGCNFCKFGAESMQKEVIKEFEFFWLVENIFPYDIWDDQGVSSHVMLVPKRHVESLGDLNPEELVEYSGLLGEYDKLGYSIYARSFKNVSKSVPHQHTHLIKLDGKEISFMLYNKKPYTLIKK
jgi:diadenosine tetraphosphate (Ap4A) HIT family hydrolase